MKTPSPRSARQGLPPGQAFVLAALVGLGSGCAAQQAPGPDLEPSTETDAANTGDGDLTAAANDSQGGDFQNADPNAEAAAPKQAILDDGYDDDWNNIGSQQQTQQQVAKPSQKLQESQEQPQLAEVEEQPVQQVPAAQPVEEIPVEEPPLDTEPAPVADVLPQPPPAPDPALPRVSGAPLIKSDVEPAAATLYWVGYDFAERDSLVRIEMVTRGSPKFNLFQERNQADQPELVVRFFNTRLRDKVRRDVDASEFRSPVAFVRMRPDEAEMSVDVIMTLRDAVQPRMYTRNGNVMLTFPIPDHYFGNSMIGGAPVAKAEVLANANIMPELDQGSDIPEGLKIAKAFINDPAAGAFPGAPADGGAPVEAPAVEAAVPDAEATPLPADFSNENSQVQQFNASNDTNLDMPDDQQAIDDQFNGEDFDQQLSENQFDNAELDGEPAPNEQAEANFQEQGDDEIESDDGQQQLDEDSLEDFDDGEGESSSEVDKFDVRVRRLLPATTAFRLSAFTLAGVAQDDQVEQQATQDDQFADEEAPLDEGAGDEDIGNASLNEQGLGNFQGAPANEQGDGNLLGEGGQGNVPPEQLAPGQSFPGFNQSAPVDTLEEPAAPVQAAPLVPVQEPPLDGQPDLAGPETEGLDTGAAPTPSAGGRPIKLDFRGAPLKDVIRVISDETGINFVIPSAVGTQTVHINLTGVPFNDALKALLETNQLGMVELGPNLIRIDTLQRIAEDRQQEEARRQAERLLSPKKVLVHRLSHTSATSASTLLQSMLAAGGAGAAGQVSVSTDARTNAVIVKATANDLATAKALLERIDLETPQVKIATRIVEVFKKASSTFGISWGGPLNFDAGRGLGFGTLPFPNQVISRYAVDAGGDPQASVGRFKAHFGSVSDSVALDLALAMEESRGTTEILQSSNMIVEDNTPALITAGTSDFFRGVVVNGAAVQGTEISYNLSVNVTPHVTADGGVGMEVDINNQSPAVSTTGATAARSNRQLRTRLLRRSGETAVIGGIYATSRSKSHTGIPGLSSLPIIGALFRGSAESDEKRELMVMITPTILSNVRSAGEAAAAGDVALNATQALPSNLGQDQFENNFNLSQQNGGGEGLAGNQGQSQQQQQQQSGDQQQTDQQLEPQAEPFNGQQATGGQQQGANQQYNNQQYDNQQYGNQQQTTQGNAPE